MQRQTGYRSGSSFPKSNATKAALKMGSFFTLCCIIFLAGIGQIYAQSTTIALPQNPRTKAVAPQPDFEESNLRTNERQQILREKTDNAGITKPAEDYVHAQKRQLLEIATSPAKLRLGFIAQLAFVELQTSGSARKDYSAEPSVAVSTLYRITGPEHSVGWQAWAGARLFSVQGSGSYSGTHGRFGYLYLGPTIGAGYFSDTPLDLPADNSATATNNSSSTFTTRRGYFFSLGINGLSRYSTTEKEKPEPEEDFKTQTFVFDAPGIQVDTHILWLKYNSLSFGIVAGLLLAKQKNFYYAGLAVGGWN